MKLPNREKSYIPQPKLTNYLLSETHAVGKSKAVFLRAIGFSGNNVSDLEGQLLEIARTEDVIEVKETPYGTKYIVDGNLLAPISRIARIRTVWIIEAGDDRPRFVTAHPT